MCPIQESGIFWSGPRVCMGIWVRMHRGLRWHQSRSYLQCTPGILLAHHTPPTSAESTDVHPGSSPTAPKATPPRTCPVSLSTMKSLSHTCSASSLPNHESHVVYTGDFPTQGQFLKTGRVSPFKLFIEPSTENHKNEETEEYAANNRTRKKRKKP